MRAQYHRCIILIIIIIICIIYICAPSLKSQRLNGRRRDCCTTAHVCRDNSPYECRLIHSTARVSNYFNTFTDECILNETKVKRLVVGSVARARYTYHPLPGLTFLPTRESGNCTGPERHGRSGKP